jgi:putative transposase
MLKAQKLRLYPNKEQAKFLEHNIMCCTFVYNWALHGALKKYKDTGENYSWCQASNDLTKEKKKRPFLNEAISGSLVQMLRVLNSGFSNFFSGRAKHPIYRHNQFAKTPLPKGRISRGSVRIREDQSPIIISTGNGVKLDGKRIKLPKIGWVRARGIRKDMEGEIRTVTIHKQRTERFEVSVLVEDGKPDTKINYNGKVVGLDVGVKSLIVTSEGDVYSPASLNRQIENVKRKLRKMSAKKIGSNNHRKARVQVSRAYERVRNFKNNYLHHISKEIAGNGAQVIAAESLDIKKMTENKKGENRLGTKKQDTDLTRRILENKWAGVLTQIKYKAEGCGKGFVKVPPYFPSTKMCSCCGDVNEELTLSDREWDCEGCGVFHDRDLNAAMNIAQQGENIAVNL